MIVYSVWKDTGGTDELMELFTNYDAAVEYAQREFGKVFELEAYDTVKECDAAGF